MLQENWFKIQSFKTFIYTLIAFVGFFFYLTTIDINNSYFHYLWAFMFLFYSMEVIIGEIIFTSILNVPSFMDFFKKKISLIIMFLIAQLQGATSLIYFLNDRGRIIVFILCVILMVYYLVLINNNKISINILNYHMYLHFLAFSGFLYVFFILGYTGALFIIIGLLGHVVAIVVYKSQLYLHSQFSYKELFNFIRLISIYLLYRGGLEMPIDL